MILSPVNSVSTLFPLFAPVQWGYRLQKQKELVSVFTGELCLLDRCF